MGKIGDLLLGADQLDPACLAAAAGVDLRFNHPFAAADLVGSLSRLLRGSGGITFRNGEAVLAE